MKRVLVISHNVFSENSNMGRTLKNYFYGWDRSDIAQLYFHSEIPTNEICVNYFRITDFDVLKKDKSKIGTIFGFNDIQKDRVTQRVDEGKQAKLYQLGSQRKPYMYIGRNLLWSTGKWFNDKLKKWIDDFDPQVIFFASGDYVFAYKIAETIADYKKIPIVTSVYDDFYYTQRKSISPLYHINRNIYKKTLRSLFAKHNNIITICDKLSDAYKKEFGVNAVTVMTSSTLVSKQSSPNKAKILISYLGNLSLNRYISLIDIGKALKTIDEKLVLDIYSSESREYIVSQLTPDNGIMFHGAIPYKEVEAVMRKSDILIHVESMDEICRNRVKYSVSTKIADSLSIGGCMFAYGPAEVASMEYLAKGDKACVATDKDMLESKLKELLLNPELREYYRANALKAAKANHDQIINAKKIREVIENA